MVILGAGTPLYAGGPFSKAFTNWKELLNMSNAVRKYYQHAQRFAMVSITLGDAGRAASVGI